MKRGWNIAAVLFLCALTGRAVNLVTNGGFETEPFSADFEIVTNDCTFIRHITWSVNDAHSGNYFIKLKGLFGDDNWLAQQKEASCPVVPGVQYKISAWIKRLSFHPDYSVHLQMVWLNSNKGYLSFDGYTESGFSGSDPDYFRSMFFATAPENAAYGRLKIWMKKGNGPDGSDSYVWIDDVAIETFGTPVANYRDDFSATSVPDSWQYLWNAPSNWVADGSSGDVTTSPVGDPSGYRALASAGTMWTPDGNTDGTHQPDAWARLNSAGGHPGSVKGTVAGGATNEFNRYVIAAYTVSEDGYYAVTDSFLSKPNSSGDAVEALVHINGQAPVRTALAPAGGSTVDYDINLGRLNANDTVYVCFGGYLSALNDSFGTDFTVTKYETANDLRAVLDDRLASGCNPVVIPAGYYRQTPTNGVHLTVENVYGKIVSMEGVNLICTETTRALEIYSCANTAFDGLRIDYSPLPFTEFQITSIAGDHKSFEMELVDGYTLSEFSGDLDSLKIFDPSTGVMRKIYGAAVANTMQTGLRTCHYQKVPAYVYDPSDPDNEQVGDLVVVSTTYVTSTVHKASAVLIGGSSNLKLSDISIYSSDKMGVFEGSCSNTVYENVQIAPPPEEQDYRLRAAPRYQSAGRDGFHFIGNRGSTVIDSCTVDYNDDDGVNIHGGVNLIQEVSGNIVTIVDKSGSCMVVPGDPVQFITPDGERAGTASVVSLSAGESPSADILDFWNTYITAVPVPTKTWNVVLDQTAPVLPVGSMVYSINRSGSNSTVTNCYFGHGRSRGVVMRGSNASIVGNVMEHRWAPAVLVCGSYRSLESGFPTNLLIEGNSLDSVKNEAVFIGYETSVAGELSPAGLYRDILIVSNAISGCTGDIIINSTDGWFLDGNTFSNAAPAIQIRNSTNGNVCARYSEAFRTGTFPADWSYLWNAPSGWTPSGSEGDVTTGPIGNPSCYRNLIPAGTMWTADGDTAGTHEPDKYIRLFESGGHPGAESGRVINSVVNAYDRYAIAAYAVPESGRYILADSCLHRPSSSGDAVEVIVHVNSDAPILTDTAAPAGEICFDTDLGDLTAGDTVYVCFGPGLTAGSDTFDMDFSIIKISDSDP